MSDKKPININIFIKDPQGRSPSRSVLSQAPRELLCMHFWQKRGLSLYIDLVE